MRPDRKELLDDLDFVWISDELESQWNKQYEKLVEFKQKNCHSSVPRSYKQDKSLWQWVTRQRQCHVKNKMLPHRKELLDEIGFAWKKAVAVAARSSTTNVRGIVILDHSTLCTGHVSNSPSFSSLLV
jgi:hypothetical protein